MIVCKQIRTYKYQLLQDYVTKVPISVVVDHRFMKLSDKGSLTIKSGYAWDGPSGPTIDTLTFMRGSLVHDALYQLIREGYLDKNYQSEADKHLRKMCLQDGMSRIRAWYVYQGVRFFGHNSVKTKIFSAPA